MCFLLPSIAVFIHMVRYLTIALACALFATAAHARPMFREPLPVDPLYGTPDDRRLWSTIAPMAFDVAKVRVRDAVSELARYSLIEQYAPTDWQGSRFEAMRVLDAVLPIKSVRVASRCSLIERSCTIRQNAEITNLSDVAFTEIALACRLRVRDAVDPDKTWKLHIVHFEIGPLDVGETRPFENWSPIPHFVQTPIGDRGGLDWCHIIGAQ